MKDFDLSITICSWNTVDDLRRCLGCLEAARDEALFEVIVVDNNSEDGSPDMVEAEFPWVRLLRQPKNLGFTGGQNLALQQAKGRRALILNSDAFVHPCAVRTLMEFADAQPDAGIIGPKLLNEDGSLQYSCRKFPNPVAALFRNTPLGRLFPRNKWVREYLMEDLDHSVTRDVDWVSGAAMLLKEDAWIKLGGFDPEFYMFCEDVDLCLRSWREGFRVVYFPESVITHKIGSSTSKAPNRMIFRFHRSMLLFYTKHQLPRVFVLLRPVAWLGAVAALAVRAGLFIVKNKVDEFKRWRQR